MSKWECFCDAVYYKLWAVKPVDCGDFNQTIHVNTKEEAEFLVESLNSAVHLSVVEEVLASTCMPEDDLKWFIKEIKKKAGV